MMDLSASLSPPPCDRYPVPVQGEWDYEEELLVLPRPWFIISINRGSVSYSTTNYVID